MSTKPTVSRSVKRSTESDGSPRLSVRMDALGDLPSRVVKAVPMGSKNNFAKGYIWIGGETAGAAFGVLPASRLLALADAIRASTSR